MKAQPCIEVVVEGFPFSRPEGIGGIPEQRSGIRVRGRTTQTQHAPPMQGVPCTQSQRPVMGSPQVVGQPPGQSELHREVVPTHETSGQSVQ